MTHRVGLAAVRWNALPPVACAVQHYGQPWSKPHGVRTLPLEEERVVVEVVLDEGDSLSSLLARAVHHDVERSLW